MNDIRRRTGLGYNPVAVSGRPAGQRAKPRQVRTWSTGISADGDVLITRQVPARAAAATLAAHHLDRLTGQQWPWRVVLYRWNLGVALARLGCRLASVERRTATAESYLPIDRATAEQLDPGRIGEHVPPRMTAIR